MKKMLFGRILGFFFFFMSMGAFAQLQPIVLEKEQIHIDDDTVLKVASVRAIPFSELLQRPSLLSYQTVSYTQSKDSIYWIKFKISNPNQEVWLLELPDPHLQFVEVHFTDTLGNILRSYTDFGFNRPFIQKIIQHKNLVVDIPLHSSDIWVYIQGRSFMASSLSIRLKKQHFFIDYSLDEYFLLGIYYGIILIMGIYNLFLFFSTKDKLYLLYILYVIGCALNSFSEDGMGFQYVWPNQPLWNNYIIMLNPFFLLMVFILYSNAFLEIKKNEPLWYKAIWISYAAFCGFQLYNFLSYPRWRLSETYLIPFLLLYITSIIIYLKGHKFARFYVLAYTMIVVSFAIFILRTLGWIYNSTFVIYSFNFGFLTEVVILSIALSDRFKMERLEREQAQRQAILQLEENASLKNTLIEELKIKEEWQDKVNRELESKVQSRTVDLQRKTSELEEFNQKLSGLVEELNSMNIKLDVDNWQLKQKVQEEVKARLTDEVVTKDTFQAIYPNEAACMRYLEELKWGNGYTCSKCGHTKYMLHQSPFVRKCTTCKQVESVTAGTLFHSVRMPLDKAFYIVYDTIRHVEPQTLEALSTHLEINKNTIWGFRKKVKTFEEEFILRNKRDPKWEEVLLLQK